MVGQENSQVQKLALLLAFFLAAMPAVFSEEACDNSAVLVLQKTGSTRKDATPSTYKVYDSHFNGWQWVSSKFAPKTQGFKATGSNILSLKLRVASINDFHPRAPLMVEIWDSSSSTDAVTSRYLQGRIDPSVLSKNFRWQKVVIENSRPLKIGANYVLIFSSPNDTETRSRWLVNASYKDTYPDGHGCYSNEDFFFDIGFSDGYSIRVGPSAEGGPMDIPINSGIIVN